MPDKILIALVDDDPAVLDSTALVLKSYAIEATPFTAAKDCLDQLSAGLNPQCIVSDVRMPGMTGLELQAELKRSGITIPLILMTGHGDVAMAVSALKAGASDFIEKPFETDLLAEAIRRAAAAAVEAQRDARQRDDLIARASHLSSRQREVMFLVADGFSNKQIANQLGISARTVETYRLWVMEKMGASSLAALVRMVLQLPPDDPSSSQ